MRSSRCDFEARAAVEGLRAGVVSRTIARHVTYGRTSELKQLSSAIAMNPEGSTQVLVGRYGVGKSHLCEVLDIQLEEKGYAVARLEMGSSDGQAENPRDVVRSIENALSVVVDGRRFCGPGEISLLLRAIEGRRHVGVPAFVREIARQYPGRANLLHRVRVIEEEEPKIWDNLGFTWMIGRHDSLFRGVPPAMTAVNLAVAAVNRLAHELSTVGVPGIVVIFDEAERSEAAWNSYRLERARDLMIGFAAAAANGSTRSLKHYRNDLRQKYIVYPPSRIHTIFAFTHEWGLASAVAKHGETEILRLREFTEADRGRIESNIVELYERAYGRGASLGSKARQLIDEHVSDEDVRLYVRTVVAALDHARLRA